MPYEFGEIDPTLPDADNETNTLESFQTYVNSRLAQVPENRKLQLLENLGKMLNLPEGAQQFLAEQIGTLKEPKIIPGAGEFSQNKPN